MRKFLLPIINLVNLILISIAWGLSGKTAIIDAGNGDYACGNMYQVIWQGKEANPIAIVGFFLFIFGCAAMLAAFIPAKWRKFVSCGAGALFIASGVLFLCSPKTYDYPIAKPELTSAFIAICVLILIAGAFSLAMSALEIFEKKTLKAIKDKFSKLTKKDRLYLGLSVGAIALSLFILIFTACKFVIWLIIVVFALLLTYAVSLFVLEFKGGKNKLAK